MVWLDKMSIFASLGCLYIERGGSLEFFLQRRESGTYKDFWEFPGGKIDLLANENPLVAVRREILEECNVTLDLSSFQFFNIYKSNNSNGSSTVLYVYCSSITIEIMNKLKLMGEFFPISKNWKLEMEINPNENIGKLIPGSSLLWQDLQAWKLG